MLGQGHVLQQMMPQFAVATPEARPEAWTQVSDPKVSYASQANGLTPTRERTLGDKVQVLTANENLFQGWSSVAGGSQPAAEAPSSGGAGHDQIPPLPGPEGPSQGEGAPGPLPAGFGPQAGGSPPVVQFPVQLRNDHVQAISFRSGKSLVSVGEDGKLEGDPSVLQAFTAANNTHEMFEGGLGRDFQYQGNGRLNVHVNDFSALWGGPHYKNGQGTIAMPDPQTSQDPDVVSHETGHAVLDAHRPNYSHSDSETRSMHEAFGDGAAMLVSLKDPDVRADVLARREEGQGSNLASGMGESLGKERAKDDALKTGEKPVFDERTSLRDASTSVHTGPEQQREPEHKASQRFSHGLYNSVMDVEAQLRKENPDLSPDDALRQASERVGSDFARTLDFLPAGNTATQSDLAQAMIRANEVDGGGSLADLYRKNFEAAHVPVDTALRGETDARVKEAMASPETAASAELREAPAGQRAQTGPQVAGIALADEWMAKNSDALGVNDLGLVAQQTYRNDRGETWVDFSDGAHPTDKETKNSLRVGFDQAGQMIHADPRPWQPEPAIPLMPALPEESAQP